MLHTESANAAGAQSPGCGIRFFQLFLMSLSLDLDSLSHKRLYSIYAEFGMTHGARASHGPIPDIDAYLAAQDPATAPCENDGGHYRARMADLALE